MPTILIIGGTNRPGANAHKLSAILSEYYTAAGATATVFNLSDMPREAFDPASYATKSPAMQAMRQRILDANGLHVAYAGIQRLLPRRAQILHRHAQIPRESFQSKPVAFTGEAMGMWGGLRSVEQLQAIFCYRNAHLYPDRVFIPNINLKLGPDGKIIDPDIASRLAKQAEGFTRFVTALTNGAK